MEQKLRQKFLDYMRFSKVLFYLSVFLFCGVVFTGQNKTVDQNFVFMLTAICFISISLLLFNKSRRIQDELDEF